MSRLSFRLLLALLAVAAVGWLADAFLLRSITTDEGISILAASAIRAHGVPLLPSQQVYDRAYLAHYALAASTAIFGTGTLGITLPALAAALGTLFFTFDLGRRALRSESAGLVACALVAVSPDMVMYATSPRMYGPLTFFCTWGAAAAWRGFVGGERRQRILAVVAAALGLQCERGAAAFVPAVAVALLCIEAGPVRQRWAAVRAKVPFGRAEWLALAGLMLSAVAVAVKPPHALKAIIVEAGLPPRFLDFSLSPERIFWHTLNVDGMLPGTMWLAAVGAFVLLRHEERARRFIPVTFAVTLVCIAALLVHTGHRMVLFLLPLYALLVAQGVVSLVGAIRDPASRPFVRRAALVSLGIYTSALGIAWGVPDRLRRAYPTAYLFPERSREGHVEVKDELLALRAELLPGDLVLTSNPWVSDYYLGRTDGILRQRLTESGNFTSFSKHRDEYFGARIYDKWSRIDALLAKLEPGQRVWFIAETKSDVYWSPEFTQEFEARFPRTNTSERLRVHRYVAPPAPK